jgi:hypothetical protein
VFKTPSVNFYDPHCAFTWTSTVFGNAPANSYRSGCHDPVTTGVPQVETTASFTGSTFGGSYYNGFTDFDTIEVYQGKTLYFTITPDT